MRDLSACGRLSVLVSVDDALGPLTCLMYVEYLSEEGEQHLVSSTLGAGAYLLFSQCTVHCETFPLRTLAVHMFGPLSDLLEQLELPTNTTTSFWIVTHVMLFL